MSREAIDGERLMMAAEDLVGLEDSGEHPIRTIERKRSFPYEIPCLACPSSLFCSETDFTGQEYGNCERHQGYSRSKGGRA